ncbi:MAG: DUF560 domain-containing protein, partial [Gammaproteobacteria bacterium]
MRHNLFAAFILLALLPGVLAAADPLDEARRLLEEGKPAAAYELLEPLLEERAGDPHYDYLLGIAALDSGHPTEAIFALERVLAVQPDHALARAEIGRAYLAVGEIDTARDALEDTLKLPGVPEQAQATVRRYLDIIEGAGAETTRTRITGFAGIDLGHDSNVNAATASRDVAIPAFGGAIFRLDDLGVEQSDQFARLLGGINLDTPLGARTRLLAGARFDQRFNREQSVFDQGNYSADLGLNWLLGQHSFTAALQYYGFSLDRKRYRDAFGATGQWRWAVNPDRNISAYLQYANLRYPDQHVRDARRVVLGGAWAESFGKGHRHQGYVGLYAGGEDNEKNLDHLSNRLGGLRAGWSSYLSPIWVLSLNASVERRRYRADEPLFLTRREDTLLEARAAIDYT